MPLGDRCTGSEDNTTCTWQSAFCQPSPYAVVSVQVSVSSTSGFDAGVIVGLGQSGGSYHYISWSNPQNATQDDGIFATCVHDGYTGGDYSHWLFCTGFGFSIPSGATILGIRPAYKVNTDGPATNRWGFPLSGPNPGGHALTIRGQYFPATTIVADDSSTFNIVASPLYGKGEFCRYKNWGPCGLTGDQTLVLAVPEGTNYYWHNSCWDTTTSSFNPAAQRWQRTWTPDNINDPTFGVGLQAENIVANTAAGTTAYVDCMGIAVYYFDAVLGDAGRYTAQTQEVFNVFNHRRVWGGR